MKTVITKSAACLSGLLLFVLLNSVTASAQHCPFDGRHLIVIQLINADGQPVLGAANNLQLREINQPTPDACTYAEGVLTKPLLAPVDVFDSLKYYKPSDLTENFCRDCTFLSPGYYAVNLDQAEQTCMIKKKSNDFDYRAREFEVEYAAGGIIQKVKIPKDRIYGLCRALGKWSRIIPVKLKIAD